MDPKNDTRQPDPTNSAPAEKALATADGASPIDPNLGLPQASVTGIAKSQEADDGKAPAEKVPPEQLPDSETGDAAGDGRRVDEGDGEKNLPDSETGDAGADAKPKRSHKPKGSRKAKAEPKPPHTALNAPPADETPAETMARIAEQSVRDFMADLVKGVPEEGADGLYAPHGHDRWAGRGFGIPDGRYAVEGGEWAAEFRAGRMVNMARRDRWEGLGWAPLVIPAEVAE